VLAPTVVEIAAVEAETSDIALNQAIETLRLTVRSSTRHRIDTKKAAENKVFCT
jgi:hypothetical protein